MKIETEKQFSAVFDATLQEVCRKADDCQMQALVTMARVVDSEKKGLAIGF